MRAEIRKKELKSNIILNQIRFFHHDGILLLLGKSGSGKTTLLRALVPGLEESQDLDGTISYEGVPIENVQPGKIGFVGQNPDNQIVCDSVWHELAFGMECMGMPQEMIRIRTAEIASSLGIEDWFMKKTSELSGGQKQKLCIASILCMGCKMIIMDEPASMLDPMSAIELWNLVKMLRDEYGIAFIIAEHSSEYIYDMADKVMYLENGTLSEQIPNEYLPITKQIEMRFPEKSSWHVEKRNVEEEIAFQCKNIKKEYGKKRALQIEKLTIYQGINAIIGPNGSGKTTLAKMISGFFGEKLIKGAVMMPQDVLTVFSKETVEEEMKEYGVLPSYIKELLEPFYPIHPLDLSGGEQHLLAVCRTLMRPATVRIFDEPTKGMDFEMQEKVEKLLLSGKEPVILISHDIEQVGRIADHAVFLFRGEVAAQGEIHEVLRNNLFYKPKISRYFSDAVSVSEIRKNGSGGMKK